MNPHSTSRTSAVKRSAPPHPRATAAAACACLLSLGVLLLSLTASAQPAAPFEPAAGGPPAPTATAGSSVITNDWQGAVRLLRVPGQAGAGAAEARAASEIFPDSNKVWMHVYGTDPRPIEGARRGALPWVCSRGCDLTLPQEGGGMNAGSANQGDELLRSIKLQTPTQPLPLTIWRPISKGSGNHFSGGSATTIGQLMFDPVLLGRRSYRHIPFYKPVRQRAKLGAAVPMPIRVGPPAGAPTPDSAELRLGFQWPATSELADFQYLAVTDTCGNARVQPFQRTFSVPVYHVASGGCGKPDGRVLRVFPSGGWMRVTAFNLDAPAAGNVVSATFRVTIPPLEDVVSADTPPLLFPDPRIDDLAIDCGPQVLKARPGPGGIPRRPPAGGHGLPGQHAPPGMSRPGASLPGQTAPPGMSRPAKTAPPGAGGEPIDDQNAGPRRTPRVVHRARVIPASAPAGQPLAHQGLVIAPEPLRRGNCRIEMHGQTKRRLVAPLAMRVRITRTDTPSQITLLDKKWIITPSDSTFRIPPLDPAGFDGESRLLVEVLSDPGSTEGNVVLLSDAGRLARIENRDTASRENLRRLVGSVTIHSAPLCGESNFETVDGAGSCLRGYFTVPAMLATLQITRAPWVERPLITRNILSAVGLAFALDSYDPVERKAFPVAFQVGGFVQDLSEQRIGLLSYVGVAPTVPILGDGGNTTSIGVLGGIGMSYITRSDGPDEGFKPAAFLSIVVQVGQANPTASTGGQHFGRYSPAGSAGALTY